MRILETELFAYPKNGNLALDINYSYYIYKRDPNIGKEFPDEWFIFLNNQNLPSNNKTASLHWSQIGFEKNKKEIIKNYLQAKKYKLYSVPEKIRNRYFDEVEGWHEGTLKDKKHATNIWQEFADNFYETVEAATKRNVANSLKRLKIFADTLNIENKEAILAADYIEQNFKLNENFGYEILIEILKRTKKKWKICQKMILKFFILFYCRSIQLLQYLL